MRKLWFTKVRPAESLDCKIQLFPEARTYASPKDIKFIPTADIIFFKT